MLEQRARLGSLPALSSHRPMPAAPACSPRHVGPASGETKPNFVSAVASPSPRPSTRTGLGLAGQPLRRSKAVVL